MQDTGSKYIRVVMKIAYDGTGFFGWQKQHKQITVQSVLEDKIGILLRQKIDIVGCGRTDTGVHAKNYYLQFDVEELKTQFISLYALNNMLPAGIVISEIYLSSLDFHVRYDAYYRKYIYRLHTYKNPFLQHNSYYLPLPVNFELDKIATYCNLILHTESFQSFVKSENGLHNYDCKIVESKFIQINAHQYEYHIAANRFVRGMVRLIVGGIINYATNKITLEQIKADIQNNKQITKSWSIPAIGLTLEEVKYPDEKMIKLLPFRV